MPHTPGHVDVKNPDVNITNIPSPDFLKMFGELSNKTSSNQTQTQAIDRNFMDNFLLRNRQGAMLPATFLDALVDRIMERVQSEGGPMNESLQNLMNIIGSRTGKPMDAIMQGLTMQSGVPGTIGQPSPTGPPSPPGPTSGVPGTAAYQKAQRLQDPRLDASMMAGMRPGDTFSNSPLPPQLMNPNLGSVPFGQNTAMSPQEFSNFITKTQNLKEQARQTYTPGM